MRILGFDVFTGNVPEIVSHALVAKANCVINTINPHSYAISKSDDSFKKSLLESNFLIPDGSGIVLAASILCKKKVEKVAGFDLFQEVMKQLNGKGGKTFFLGSTDKVLGSIKSRASSEFENLEVETYSPPFSQSYSDEQVANFAERINQFCPDVLFVGLTAPKQEKLISRLQALVSDVSILSGIGAVFDFYAGTVKRPSAFWVHLQLEWLVRLLGEPRRLWRRNFISTPIFLKDVMIALLKGRR